MGFEELRKVWFVEAFVVEGWESEGMGVNVKGMYFASQWILALGFVEFGVSLCGVVMCFG